MSAKKIFRVLAMMSAVLMMTTLLLTSCGEKNPSSDPGTSSSANTDPVTIRIAGEGQLLVTLLGKKYTALHPNVTIEYYNPDG